MPTAAPSTSTGSALIIWPAHKRGAAMVFQDYALFPHLRVYDNVAYGLRLAGMPKLDIAQRVQETLQFVDLSGLVDRWPSQLSGGQQQRVALARGPCYPSESAAARRTPQQPGCQPARTHALGFARFAAAPAHHVRIRHARSGRGTCHVGLDRRNE